MNLHTEGYVAGAIRGHLKPTPIVMPQVPALSAWGLGALCLALVGMGASRLASRTGAGREFF